MNTDTQTPTVPKPTDPKVEAFTDLYADYLVQSPTSYHAVQEASSQLVDAGFIEVDLRDRLPAIPGGYFTRKGGALLAWVLPDDAPEGFAIVAAHTDSPALKLKPTPQRTSSDGWGQLLVEVYGGPLYNSWLDRELLLAGTVMDKTGAIHLVETDPIARIPQLAPHLDRTQNSEGVVLDAQKHLQPVWFVGEEQDVLDLVADGAGIDTENILSYELFLVPAQEPSRFGVSEEFLAAARQDNLSSTYAGLTALIRAYETYEASGWPTPLLPVFAAFDHEEVGSASATGARSDLLPSLLRRLAELTHGTDSPEDSYGRMIAASTLISADAGHSVHPNYAAKIDPDTRPVMGAGPILKVDADQRYATSAESIGLWELACQKANVPTQAYVTESSMRSGSTIGPALSTALGVTTADVGIALLSMHSTREMSHVADTYLLSEALEGYWTLVPVWPPRANG